MGTTKKDNNKVDFTTPTNPLQEQGQKIDVVVNDKPDYNPTERIPQQEDYRKQNQFQNKQSESINPYKEEVESKTPAFDMQTMINDLNAREEEALKKNEEERKKESRYHRARAIISAIGDGLSGLANIYYTTKGAPDMLKGTTSMSAKQQERWDKIRKEREARREAYLKAVRDNNRESLKNAYTQWKDDRDYELKVQQEERQKRQAEVKAMKDEAMALYYANKADKEGYLALTKAAEANNMEEFLRLKNEVLKSQAKKNDAQAANAGKSGGSGRSSGGSGRKGSGDSYTTIKETTTDTFNPFTGQKEKKTTTSKTTRTPGAGKWTLK